MKFIILSDTHLHEWTYGAVHEHGLNSRLGAQARALDQVRDYAVRNEIEYVFHCGDMFHKHGTITAPVITVAYDAFSSWRAAGLHTTFLVGNHDMSDRKGTHCLSWLNKLGTVIDRPVLGWFSAMPYTEDSEVLKKFLADAKASEAKMVLLHQGVEGCAIGSGYVINEILTPGAIPEGLSAFTGHYHLHNKVTPDLTIVGSLTPNTWTDANTPKGFLVFDDETRETEFIEVDAPKFLQFETPEDFDKYLGEGMIDGNFVKLSYAVEDRVSQIAEIRGMGALTVEIPEGKVGTTGLKLNPSTFDLEGVIEAYQSNCNVDEETVKMGESIRRGSYEIANV